MNGRAISVRLRELRKAYPSASTRGVSANVRPTALAYPRSIRVSSSRRAVGLLRPVASATSLSVHATSVLGERKDNVEAARQRPHEVALLHRFRHRSPCGAGLSCV